MVSSESSEDVLSSGNGDRAPAATCAALICRILANVEFGLKTTFLCFPGRLAAFNYALRSLF